MFEPIRTERLVLRAPTAADADALFERRNEPSVAEFQSWSLPYPRERVDQIIGAVAVMEGPTDDDWWMATVCLASDDTIIGDVAIHLTWQGRSAEIGFTFAKRYWGAGYAFEATAAMVEWLLRETDAMRIHAMTHPDNIASAMLLERLGMLYEGRTKGSYWVNGECTDDLLYGMTRDDRTAWTARRKTPPDDIRLIEITPENLGSVERLATHNSQKRFVAPVSGSLADALVPEVVNDAPLVPWFRVVEADGQLVGFVMLATVTEHHPDPYLWRLLVDRMHQRRGIGSQVIDLVAELCREWGADRLQVSWCDGRGSPRPLYEHKNFVPTGRIVDGEIEAILDLTTS